MEEYEKIKNMLEAKTGMKNINEILELYTSYAEKNDSLYAKVNFLNDEKEKIELEINEVQREIDTLTNKPHNEENNDERGKALQDIRVNQKNVKK